MKSILVVCQYYHPEPLRITEVCEELQNRGYKVTVLTGLPNYSTGFVPKKYKFLRNRKEIINGVEIIRTFEIGRRNNSFFLFFNYFSFIVSSSFKSLKLSKKYDFIFVYQLSPIMMAIPAIIYKNIRKKKLLLYCLDLWPESLTARGIKKDNFIYNIFYKLSKYIYNQSDEILISSKMFEKYFKETLNIKDKELIYLPQYAEGIFEEAQMEIGSISNDIKTGKYNFVFAGNIGALQGVEIIVEAAKILKENEDIKFHIVGNGYKLSECKILAQEYKLNNIVFYGRKDIKEMPKYYKIADAMLITLNKNESLSYTLPGKVQSYLAFGKPIIGSIDGETNELINSNNLGYCCEAEDIKCFAEIIEKMCDKKLIENLSNNAYNYYKENFSKEVFHTKLENRFKNLYNSR